MRTSIPCKMKRLSNHWCSMGKWISIFWWWWHVVNLQRLTSTITVEMPYKFDEELWELIVEIRGIWKDLLSMQLELFGSFPSATPVSLIDYLAINCILQANKIQHDLLDLRLAIILEKDLSFLIHPHNVTWPNHYVHLILLQSLLYPYSYWQLRLWSPCSSFLFITSQTAKSLWMCRWCHQTQDIGYSPSPTLLINHTFSIFRSYHSTPGASSSKGTGRTTQSIFCIRNQRSHQSIGSPYCSKAGQAIQAISSILSILHSPTLSSGLWPDSGETLVESSGVWWVW